MIFAIDLNFTIDNKLNKIGKGRISFRKIGQNQIALTADAEIAYPITFKAYRMRLAKEKFKGLKLVTDNRNFFK